MKNLDEFQEKYPDLYAAIFERGMEAGSEDGKTIADNNKPGTSDSQSFEEIVRGYTAQGLSRGDAIRKAVSENSDAHEDYLVRVNDNHAQKLPAKTSAPFKKFEDCVAHFISENQVTTAAAIKSAVTQYPELHAEYVARLKQGEKGALCQS
jgi:hypothetical protein